MSADCGRDVPAPQCPWFAMRPQSQAPNSQTRFPRGEQATRFNRRLINACLRANAQPDAVRPGQLHVAIIGAGAASAALESDCPAPQRAASRRASSPSLKHRVVELTP